MHLSDILAMFGRVGKDYELFVPW